MTRQQLKTARRRPGRPLADSSVDTRNALLLAAIDQFGERGFDGVSLKMIAEGAQTDVGLTRYYFGSKTGLWQAAIDHLATEFVGGLSLLIHSGQNSATDRLKSVIRWFVEVSAKWPHVSRIIVFESNGEDERASYIAEHLVSPFYEQMEALIEKTKSEGALPNVSNRTIFFMIAHGSSFPMALPRLTNRFPGGDISSSRALKSHAEAIIQLLFKPD